MADPGRRSRIVAVAVAVVVALVLAVAILVLRREGSPASSSTSGQPATATASSPPAAQAPAPTRLPIAVRAPEPAQASPDALPGSFEGRVVSRVTGAGVPGAELTFSRAGAAASTRSGADGAFRFEAPAEGRWLLAAVTARGYLPFAPEWGHSPVELEARAGRHLRGVEIFLVPATEILGRVVDGEGKPVPEAQVRLLGLGGEATLVSIPDRFTSDAAGEFRFSAPQGAVVEARKPGFAAGRAELDLLATIARRITIRLGPVRGPAAEPGRIAGRVVARESAAPIPGALVVAEPARGFGPSGVVVAQATSGADGGFDLGGLDAGRYHLTARADGRAPATLVRIETGTKDAVLELRRGGRLRGCVRDAASGTAVAPFTVLVFERRASLFRPLRRSRSFLDPSGCYALDDLQPGPAAVVISAQGYAPSAEVPADVPESGEAVADATVARGGRLRGVVLDDATRAPLAGARISVEGSLAEAASTFPVLSEAVSDEQGRFVLDGLPRRFSFSAAAAGHHARVVGGNEVAPGSEAAPIEIALHAVAPGEEPRTELPGIGAMLTAREDMLIVSGLAPRGGAAEAGIVLGDAIVRVNGIAVTELGFAGAVDTIRGPEGTFVVLTIRRGDSTFDVRVPRRLVRG
jgi:carboxypeptidase family protein/PDZ domain-containing protein